MNLRSFRLLLNLDPAEGGAAKTDPPAAPDLAKQVEDVLKKHGGDQTTAVRAILTELNTTRDQVSALTAKFPKDGHHVIDGDSHKLFSAYQSLGKPEDLTKALEDAKTVSAELTGIKRSQHFAEVAGLAKFKPSVLTKLASDDNLEIVVKEEPDPKDATKKAVLKVPHVKLEGDKTEPLAVYAERQWKDFLPSLKAEPATTAPALRGTPPPAIGSPRPPVTPKEGARRASNALS